MGVLFKKVPSRKWLFLVGLLLIVPLTSLFLGFRLPGSIVFPSLEYVSPYQSPVVMFLAAVPLVLAAGFLGPFGATLVGGFTGILWMLWETHSLFTPLLLAGLAYFYSLALRQNYRSPLFNLLRHPIGSGLVVPVLYLPVVVLAGFVSINGSTAARLDYALTFGWQNLLAFLVEMLVAGIVGEILYVGKVKNWGNPGVLNPAPPEINMESRINWFVVPGMIIGFTIFMILNWEVTRSEVEALTRQQFINTATIWTSAIQRASENGNAASLHRLDFAARLTSQPDFLDAAFQGGINGTVLDSTRKILYHTDYSLITTDYMGHVPEAAQYYEEVSPQGALRAVYAIPVPRLDAWVVLTMPAEAVHTQIMKNSAPAGFILFIVILAMCVGYYLLVRRTSSSLRSLERHTGMIASGNLDYPVQYSGLDEVGRLSSAFEQMRQSLKSKMDESGHLVSVSQAIAANLGADGAFGPVLQAAVKNGAVMARVALVKETVIDSASAKTYAVGCGSSSELFAYLDEQIFEMMRLQDVLFIPNTFRMRHLRFSSAVGTPGAIAAIALRRDGVYLGVLWVAYALARSFEEEEILFLTRLAEHAALAASNARLYSVAEKSRQRLEAVLNSTPEPLLVMDERHRLVFLNPAALQVQGFIASTTPGAPMKEVIAQPALLEFINIAIEELPSREIQMPNGRVYYVSISPVVVERDVVGKVIILRDITYFKELDTIKSEFVSTVSHDLRAPLTLLRGYATMMPMVGNLNDQQVGYVNKIISGVESMNGLVNNLLNLGRIEAGVGLQIEKVSATEVTANVINSLMPQAVQKNIRLIHDMPQQPIVIQADLALLQQALYNLVENAIKYTPVGGQVGVRLQLRSSTVVFEVSDTGIGIAPLDLPHMFEKFYRSGRREAYQQRGTGLGLAIVKSISERHKGRVWVESQLGKYSTFFLEIPYQQS